MSVGTIATPEVRLNSYTTNDQVTPAVAMDHAGNYVAVWESTGQDGSGDGIFAQRYNSSGVAVGSTFKVNTFTTGDQDSPAVAMDAAGDFVIAWDSKAQVGSGLDVFAQRYNAAGVAQGSEFRVNTYTTGDQSSASVALDQSGNFVITWLSAGQLGLYQTIPLTGIYAQRYNSAGAVQGTEFKVNPVTTDGNPVSPRIAMDSAGDFAVTWATYTITGGSIIFARRYNSAGVALANEFRVYTSATSDQYTPAIAMDGVGDFTVTWTDVPRNSNLYAQIYAQRYTPAGVVKGAAFRVNTFTQSLESNPTIAYDSAGDFVIGWQSYGQSTSYYAAYAQRYLAAGTPQGTEFTISPNTAVIQSLPVVAMDSAGDFIFAWQSFPQDGYGYGVYARRYLMTAPANHAPSGAAHTVTMLEDTAYVFKAVDFGFSDPLDAPANTLLSVKITTLPMAGVLTDNGIAVVAGAKISAAEITAGKLKFAPAANRNGTAYSSFTFQVQDNGGTAKGGIDTDPTARTMTISVTSVNDAPTGAAKTVTTLEDTAYVFKATDFVLNDSLDVPANALSAVKITTLPLVGRLTDNGVVVAAGAHVALADITAGKLKFTPVANKNGATYASFTFQVQDNGGTANGGIDTDTIARTMTISVTSVNDAPVGVSKTVTTLEDTAYVLKVSDFVMTDPLDVPANSLLAVKITMLPTVGVLTNNGMAVSVGSAVAVADINAGRFKFTPAANKNGAIYARFNFQVQDNGGTASGGINTDPVVRVITIAVTPVNDAPVGAAKTVAGVRNTPYVFKVTDFTFTDPSDTPANSLLSVKITTLPTVGSLTDNGVAVSIGASISLADITAGKVKFAPVTNGTGAAYSHFTFQVQDNGGTANGGLNTDLTPRTMTISMT